MLAPIVLFVYNRLEHTQKTIESLAKNQLAKKSDILIFSDGPRVREDTEKVLLLRKYLKNIKGFRNINLIEREYNLGLSKNIKNGISETLDIHGKAIIMEDDIITSPKFLSYMNDALEKYSEEKNVWHINAYQYPFVKNKILSDTTAFSRLMNCWGWGTWSDRWKYYNKNPLELIETFTKKDIYKFNIGIRGHGSFWTQVLSIYNGEYDSWDIFWYATIFIHKGLCLSPITSFTNNIGTDGSGTHFNQTLSVYTNNKLNEGNWDYPSEIKENPLLISQIKKFIISTNNSFTNWAHIKNNIKSMLPSSVAKRISDLRSKFRN